MSAEELRQTILLDLHKDVGQIKVTLAEMKVDVAEHIKRSHMLEAKVNSLDRLVWMVHGAWLFAGVVFAVWKVWASLPALH